MLGKQAKKVGDEIERVREEEGGMHEKTKKGIFHGTDERESQ